MQDKQLSIAALLLALAILAHALIPRYEISFHGAEISRVDRWTGHVEGGHAGDLSWVSGPQTAKLSDIESVETSPAK